MVLMALFNFIKRFQKEKDNEKSIRISEKGRGILFSDC